VHFFSPPQYSPRSHEEYEESRGDSEKKVTIHGPFYHKVYKEQSVFVSFVKNFGFLVVKFFVFLRDFVVKFIILKRLKT